MALEIERKFLVKGKPWQNLDMQGTLIVQGYLSIDPKAVVRVRLCKQRQGDAEEKSAFITIKSKNSAISSHEYEYTIPTNDAEYILHSLTENHLVEKVRHRIFFGDTLWEVDEFLGANAGLVLAEIELPSEDTPFALPAWVTEEVTYDTRYKNAQLALQPFNTW